MVGLATIILKAAQLVIYMTRNYDDKKEEVKVATGRTSVSCQSMATYRRKLETPRFQPLSEMQHGIFEEVWQ